MFFFFLGFSETASKVQDFDLILASIFVGKFILGHMFWKVKFDGWLFGVYVVAIFPEFCQNMLISPGFNEYV